VPSRLTTDYRRPTPRSKPRPSPFSTFLAHTPEVPMPNLGPTELIIILLIVILLFGAKKIPEIAKGLGKGIKDFKGAMKESETPSEHPRSVSKPSENSDNRPAAWSGLPDPRRSFVATDAPTFWSHL